MALAPGLVMAMKTQIGPDPDHVPHDVVGTLALSIVFIAILTFTMWTWFGTAVTALMLAVVAVWWIVRLSRRASRERKEEALHPPKPERIDPHDRQIS
jgi:Ca2+/Na+ antiporter